MAEKSLKEHDALLTDEIKTQTREAIDALNSILSQEEFDLETGNSTLSTLREASMKIGQHVYANQKPGADAGASGDMGGEAA